MKKHFSIVLILLIIFGLFFFYKKNVEITKKTDFSAKRKSSQPDHPREKLMDRVKSFPGLKKANLCESEKVGACKNTIESLEMLPLNTLIHDLKNGSLNLELECLNNSNKDVPSLNGFPGVCNKRPLKNEIPDECRGMLYFYKALRIHYATLRDDTKSLSTEVLINKILALFLEQSYLNADGLKQIRSVGSHLRERLPNSDAAAKTELIGYIADENLTETDKHQFEERLNVARLNFPENWEIYEIDLIRKKRAGNKSYLETIKSYYSQNPDSGIANYHMGCMSWDGLDKTNALVFFETAFNIEPENKRFKETRENAVKYNPPEKVCNIQINFKTEEF